MRSTVRQFLTGALSAAVLTACSGGGGSSSSAAPPPPPPPANQAPTAVAGDDQAVIEDQTVLLDASASTDADGTVSTFSWSQIAGPTVTLNSTSIPEPRFTAPTVTSDQTVTLRLTVTDDDGDTATDDIDIDISPDVIDDATVVQFSFDGEERAYTLFLPDSFQPGNPAMLLLHGGSGSMTGIVSPDRTTRRWVEQAIDQGWALVVPNGFNETAQDGLGDQQSWNDLRNDTAGRTSLEDDAGFLLTVLDDAQTRASFDTDKVYIGGSSNGGMMTMRMLIESPERFAAGVAYIASLPEEAVPTPSSPTPLMMLNGSDDQLVLTEGGAVGANGSPTRPVADTIDYWISETGADENTEAFSSLPNTVPGDGCVITVSSFTATGGGPDLFRFYEAVGGGHNIPDPTPPPFGPQTLAVVGPICEDVHGVDLAVEFFLQLD